MPLRLRVWGEHDHRRVASIVPLPKVLRRDRISIGEMCSTADRALRRGSSSGRSSFSPRWAPTCTLSAHSSGHPVFIHLRWQSRQGASRRHRAELASPLFPPRAWSCLLILKDQASGNEPRCELSAARAHVFRFRPSLHASQHWESASVHFHCFVYLFMLHGRFVGICFARAACP